MTPTRLPREVDALVRPAPGVVGLARERVEARECRGTFADDRQPVAMMRKRAVTASPRVGRRPSSAARPRRSARASTRVSKLDVAPQVEAVGDVLDVAQDLGLGRVALGPLPLLLELLGELVRVLHALDVAARARVAVPVPGAADVAARLERPAPRSPSSRSRWSMYMPAKPAPTTTASTWAAMFSGMFGERNGSIRATMTG